MSAGRPLATAVVLLLLTTAAHAQDLDIFEVSDFVDPRLRGVRFDSEGSTATEPGSDYFVIRAVVGGAANYSWRTIPSDANVAFAHLSSSYYRALNQLNVKLTSVQSESDSSLPRWRTTAQFARYMLRPGHDPLMGNEEIAGRYLLTASIEESRLCSKGEPTVVARCSRHFDSEIGLQLDTTFILPITKNAAAGSFIVALRDTAEKGQVYRGTYTGRLYRTLNEKTRLTFWYELNGEYLQSLHWGATRVGASASIDLGKDVTAHLSWMPSYVPNQPGRRVYNEFAVFFDRKVFSRLWERLPPKPFMSEQ